MAKTERDTEEWRAVKGHEGRLEVSSIGRVRRLSWEIVEQSKDGDAKQMETGKWYYKFFAHDKSSPRFIRTHRAVACAFLPNPNNWPQVNHKNGNPQDNHVSNLEWCTASMNALHAFSIGLKIAPRGEEQGSSKLKESQVKVIRELYNSGTSGPELARRFNVVVATIYKIIHRKHWSHIE